VGLKELSSWLDVTQRRVIQLTDEGVLPKEGRGKYRLQECVAQYIAYLRRMSEGTTRTSELNQEKLLTARIERRRRELEYAQHEGSLITIEAHKAAMAEAFDLVRSNVRNLPGALAPRLVGLDDARDIQQVLVREIDDALRSIVGKAERRIEDSEGLPKDIPGRGKLIAAGVRTLVDLIEVDQLTDLPGIGSATAKKIRLWMGDM